MALTKADMAESLFNVLGLNKIEARELDSYDTVEQFLDEVTSAYESRIRQQQPEEILY